MYFSKHKFFIFSSSITGVLVNLTEPFAPNFKKKILKLNNRQLHKCIVSRSLSIHHNSLISSQYIKFFIFIFFSSITGVLVNLTEPFAPMVSEMKPVPLCCLKTVNTIGMTNLATPEELWYAKTCPFLTLILSGTRTLESTSLKFVVYSSIIGLITT